MDFERFSNVVKFLSLQLQIWKHTKHRIQNKKQIVIRTSLYPQKQVFWYCINKFTTALKLNFWTLIWWFSCRNRIVFMTLNIKIPYKLLFIERANFFQNCWRLFINSHVLLKKHQQRKIQKFLPGFWQIFQCYSLFGCLTILNDPKI